MNSTLEAAAARCGAHCWVERRLFEALGVWGASAGSPRAVVALDRASQHAAWRAAQWLERLPVLAGVDREALVAAPPGWAELLGAAGSHPPALEGAGVVAVAARVLLPRLAERYRTHQAEATPVADRPALRTLAQCLADLRCDREDLDGALHAALAAADGPELAADAVLRADRLLAARQAESGRPG